MTYGEMHSLFQRAFPNAYLDKIQWSGQDHKFFIKGLQIDKTDKSNVISLATVIFENNTCQLTDCVTGDTMSFALRELTQEEKTWATLARWHK
jgi:hypothetical protein